MENSKGYYHNVGEAADISFLLYLAKTNHQSLYLENMPPGFVIIGHSYMTVTICYTCPACFIELRNTMNNNCIGYVYEERIQEVFDDNYTTFYYFTIPLK